MYPERIKDLYLRGNNMVMIDPERIQRLAAKMGNRNDALELVRQMRCGGKKYPGGGKFFRTNLQNESPMMYQPILPSVPDVPVPARYEPQPHLGLYEYPSTTGMVESYPVTLPPRVPVVVRDNTPAPVAVEEEPVIDLFSDKAKAERRLMQRYAESLLDDKASSPAGAKGPWQIMDITVQDYLNNGGKPGDIFNPEYNGGIRDWAFSVIPKRLGEFWSENDSDINKLAKLYAAYNWGAGNLKKFLRSRIEAGLSNDDPYEWVEAIKNKGKRPNETKNYVKFLALNQDIPDSYLTREKFENAARAKGYMAEGGPIGEYPEGYNGEIRQGKPFNAWDRYVANHPMAGHRIRKAKALLADAARVHPLTALGMDIYDIITQKSPEDRNFKEDMDIATTALGTAGRTVQSLYGIPAKILGETEFLKDLKYSGKLLAVPDLLMDSSKFIMDFAEPVENFKSGGKIHIKPENRGKFNALLKRTGKSASWFKEHGTPLQRKRATFALNARKWKHGDGGYIDNYFYDGGPYGVIPLGGDYLTYLQTMPEVSGGAIEPSVVTAALPAKFNGSQAAAARYAEGYQKGAKPVSEAISRAGQDIFNTVDTVVGLTPTPAGAISWLGHMGADAAEGEWGKVGRDAALALALGAGARGVGWLKNYVDDATNFGEDIFRAFTDRVPGRVSTNFVYDAPKPASIEPGFWSNKALGIMAKNGNAEAAAELASRPYEIENLGGGYMLKSLMRGNPLEKQISKNGTVNVNNVRALVGKGSRVEQAVVDKVLASEEFAGKKVIDYNKFRKAVQDELITYERTPDTRWATYGEDAIGFRAGSPTELREINEARTFNDKRQVIEVYGTYEEKMQLRDMTHLFRDGEMTEAEYDDAFDKLFSDFSHKRTGGAKSETYVFSSSRIPNGSAKHYDPNTLGHSRTYTTADEPNVLHVMESQSDWAQGEPGNKLKYKVDGGIRSIGTNSGSPTNVAYNPESKQWEFVERGRGAMSDFVAEQRKNNKQLAELLKTKELDSQGLYLADNYTSRQIQENLRYAAEKGQTKMRYPTRETAAKIEGYPGEDRILYFDKNGNQYNDPLNEAFELDKEIESLRAKLNKEYDNYAAGDISARDRISELTNKITEMPEKPKRLKEGVVTKTITTYRPEHEGILKKYDAFPKQFKKLYKNADVRIVTDPKGNTWYEVDVPENYLQQEWAFEEGGSMILPKMMMGKHSPDKLRKAIASIKAKRMG